MPVKSSGPGVLGRPFGRGPFQQLETPPAGIPPPTDVPVGPLDFYDLQDWVAESYHEPKAIEDTCVIISTPLTTDSPGWVGFANRKAYPNYFSVSGNQVRVTFKSGINSGLQASHCSIALVGGATPPNATPPMVELTFFGTGASVSASGHGFTIPANSSVTSDWMPLNFGPTDNFLIDIDVFNPGDTLQNSAAISGTVDFFKASANDYLNATVTGYTTGTAQDIFVSLIEGCLRSDTEQIAYLDADAGIEDIVDDASLVEPEAIDSLSGAVTDVPLGPQDFYDLQDAVTESYQEPKLVDAAVTSDNEQIVVIEAQELDPDEVTDSYQEPLAQDDPETVFVTMLDSDPGIEEFVDDANYFEPLPQDNPETVFITSPFDLFEVEDEVTESYQEPLAQDNPETVFITSPFDLFEVEDEVTDSYQEPLAQDNPETVFVVSPFDVFEVEDEVTDSLQEPALIDAAAIVSDTEQIVYLDSDPNIEEFVDDASLVEPGLVDAAPVQTDVPISPFGFYDLPDPFLGLRLVIPTGTALEGPFDNEQIVYLDSDPGIEEFVDDANFAESLPVADVVAALVGDVPVGPVDFYDLQDLVTESYQETKLVDAVVIVTDNEQIVYLDSDPGIEEFVDDANYFETFPQDDPEVSYITVLEAEQEIVEEPGVDFVDNEVGIFNIIFPDNEQIIYLDSDPFVDEEPGLDFLDNDTPIFGPPPPPPDNEQTGVIEAEQEIEDLPGLDFLDNETAIFAFPVAPPAAVIAATGGRDARRLYRELYEEQEFVLHWLLMDD